MIKIKNENNLQLYPKLLAIEVARLLGTTVQNVHKKIKDGGLQAYKSQNRVFFGHTTAKKLLNINFKSKIFSFQLVKGGVGKTACSFNFAIRAALLGAKVALIELDQQANLTRTFRIDASDKPILIDVIKENLSLEKCLVPVMDGLDFLPSRVDNALLDNILLLDKHPLDKVILSPLKLLKQNYDVIVIDCPPSIGASVSAAALASDIIVMPVIPTDYAIAGLQLTYKEINNLFKKYEKQGQFKILFNQYDSRTSLSFNALSELIKDEVFGKLMINSYIRKAQSIENHIANGKSIFDTIKDLPEKEDVAVVTQELLEIV
jgi:chromosome partitioning protein